MALESFQSVLFPGSGHDGCVGCLFECLGLDFGVQWEERGDEFRVCDTCVRDEMVVGRIRRGKEGVGIIVGGCASLETDYT